MALPIAGVHSKSFGEAEAAFKARPKGTKEKARIRVLSSVKCFMANSDLRNDGNARSLRPDKMPF